MGGDVKPLRVEVHIREHNDKNHRGSLKYLTWYYNGISAAGINLRVPNSFNAIRFELDASSKKKFKLTAPEVTRYSIDDTSDYEDLDPTPVVTDEYVEVNNSQIHHGPDTVGAITLVVTRTAPGGHDYHPASLMSDPEITNTNGDHCRHCDDSQK